MAQRRGKTRGTRAGRGRTKPGLASPLDVGDDQARALEVCAQVHTWQGTHFARNAAGSSAGFCGWRISRSACKSRVRARPNCCPKLHLLFCQQRRLSKALPGSTHVLRDLVLPYFSVLAQCLVCWVP